MTGSLRTFTPAQQAFMTWLQHKEPRDYWYYPQAPADYALQARETLLKQLAARQLPCEHVIWHVTNACNLRCVHCGVWGGERTYRDISTRDFLSRLPQLLELGLQALTLSGGEPFLRKDIFELIQQLQQSGVRVACVTNGYFIERDWQVLHHTPPDSLSISLDGLAPAHNMLRAQAQSFETVLASIRLAAQTPIPLVNVNTSVFPANLGDLPALREAIFAAGARHWVLRPVALSGRAQDPCLKLSDPELHTLLCFAEDSVRQGYDLSVEGLGYLGPWDSILSLAPYVGYAGWNSLYILPDGSLKGFNEDALPIEGHFLQDDLARVWYEGFGFYRFPEIPDMCRDCRFWPACGGGNVAEADSGWRCIRPLLEQQLS